MKRYRADIIATGSLVLFLILFFAHLFYPEPQLIVTPDYGRNDAFDRSFSTKYLVWQRTRQGALASWTSDLSGGQPILGDSAGAFYPPQLLFNMLTDSVTAYNALLISSILFFGFGMYMWLRIMSVGVVSAAFGAMSLMMSGIIIPRLTHAMVIPALSWLPWIMLTTLLFFRKPTAARYVAWIGALSLQILANFPQATFISVLFAGSYHLFLWRQRVLWGIGTGVAALTLAVGLGAVQLLPAWEYHQNSFLKDGFGAIGSTSYSFQPKDILMLFHPFALGNPGMGSYTPFWQNGGDIFWENNGFIGIVPFLLIVYEGIRIAFVWNKTEHRAVSLFFFSTAGAAALLMLGNYAPTYPLHGLFPFSLFRTPSRYLWIFVSCAIVLAARASDQLWQKARTTGIKAIFLLLLGGNVVHLFFTWNTYHLIRPAAPWMAPPEILASIDMKERLYTIGSSQEHNKMIVTSGWKEYDFFLFMRNFLSPNSNIIWSVPHIDAYSGVPLRRTEIMDTLIRQGVDTRQGIATISASAKKILDLTGVGTVISAYPVDAKGLTLITESRYRDTHLYVYANPARSPRVYFAGQVVPALTLTEAYRAFENESFITGFSAVTGTALDIQTPNETATVSVSESADMTTLSIVVRNNPGKTLLVVTDTYYPGWKATVDDKPTEILPVNIRHRGLIVPQGDHIVVFHYEPESLKSGAIISGVALAVIIGLGVFPFVVARIHTQKITVPTSRRPRHNPYT
ncbi:MAG TPA: YfhO family protein [Patescibacteria group bacterium]|nr:YfhO family protein [Patescibacteria group bacterium]